MAVCVDFIANITGVDIKEYLPLSRFQLQTKIAKDLKGPKIPFYTFPESLLETRRLQK